MSSESDIQIWQHGFVKDGVLKPYNQSLQKQVLDFYNNQQVEFCIRKQKQKATLKSHAYYRGVILPICAQSEIFGGYSKDKIHELFASLFLKDVKTMEVAGKIHMVTHILSTSVLSRKAMADFIDHVRNWLSDHGIFTPEPEIQIEDDKKNS